MKNLLMLLAITFSFAVVNAQTSTVKKSCSHAHGEVKSAEVKKECTKAEKKECTKAEKKECSKSAAAKKSCDKSAATSKSCSKSSATGKACCSKDAAKSASLSKSAATTKSCAKGEKKSCAKTCGGGAAAYNKLVSPQDFKSYMDRFPAEQVVDIRTKAEIKKTGMIEGAQNIDFNASYFKEEMGKLDRNAAVMIYCRSGNRSGKAVPMLKEMGFKKIYDMEGGYMEYMKSDLK